MNWTKSSVLFHSHYQTAVEIMGLCIMKMLPEAGEGPIVTELFHLQAEYTRVLCRYWQAGPVTNLPFMSPLHLTAPLKWIFCVAWGQTSSPSLRRRRGGVGEGGNSTTFGSTETPSLPLNTQQGASVCAIWVRAAATASSSQLNDGHNLTPLVWMTLMSVSKPVSDRNL